MELARRKEIEKYVQVMHDIQSEMATLATKSGLIQQTIWNLRQGRGGEHLEKKEFVRKCPVNDCRGCDVCTFRVQKSRRLTHPCHRRFLSTRWKCDVCENYICVDCNEIKKDDTHTCDPNAVETIKLLKKVRGATPLAKSGTDPPLFPRRTPNRASSVGP